MATRIETAYTRRARCYSSADGFNIKRPAVPAHVFTAERDRALDPAAPTGLIPLDLSGPLGLDFPATTPLHPGPHAVMITPPADAHSHHNDGDHLALFLIVQDGGLHYHTRTMGFSYE